MKHIERYKGFALQRTGGASSTMAPGVNGYISFAVEMLTRSIWGLHIFKSTSTWL